MQAQPFHAVIPIPRHAGRPARSSHLHLPVAICVAFAAFMGFAGWPGQAMAGKPGAPDMAACRPGHDFEAQPRSAGQVVADHPIHPSCDRDRDRASGVCAEIDHAHGAATQEFRLSLQQALVDDAAGKPAEARKLYDKLAGTPWEARAAIPSAINLVSLDRFDEAQHAFAALSGSADLRVAGYAQIWQLWITMRTYRGDARGLRGQMARATVGLRAADGFQQALLNLYAGQGSVEAVFSAAEAATSEGSPQRRDARTQAALFAGGYLQYVAGDAAMAQRIYRRELPQSSGSPEQPVLLRLIGNP